MEQQRFKKEGKDTDIYADSLSQVNTDRENTLNRIDSLKLQGKTEDDLEIKGLRFNLKELAKAEKEIRENIGRVD